MLEAVGYIVTSHTKKDWVVFTHKGKKIVFKKDTGITRGMPCIDLHTNKAGLAMIETVHKNFGSYAKHENEKAKLSCTVQSRIGHPSNEHYKRSMSRKDLKKYPIDINDVKSAEVIFGPY